MSGSTRLADQIVAAAAKAPGVRMEPGEIAAFAAGIATVTWQGTDVQAAYLSSYTPVAGHTVLLLVAPLQIVILGRLIGTPA